MNSTQTEVSEFKSRVEKEWTSEETAAAWQKYFPKMRDQMAAVTETLVKAADPQPGMSVLDLASGVGEPSLSLAKKVKPGGSVTATDLSSAMLEALKVNAEAEGLDNIQTKVVDAHELPFPDGSFDLVTSRFGVMFFAELDHALAEIKRVLKPGGKIAFLVWGAPEQGSYFAATALPYIRRLAVKPDPDGPSPMRFAEPGKLVRLVDEAGFTQIEERVLTLPTAFQGSPQELHESFFEIAAPIRNMAASLSDEDRKQAEIEVRQGLQGVYDGTYTRVTAPIIVVTGRKS